MELYYRLNVAGLRTWLKIKDGSVNERCEHVDHSIKMLEDQEVFRARDRAKNRQRKTAFGSSNYRQKPTNPAPSAPAKTLRAIQIQANDSGSDCVSDRSGGSDFDINSHLKIFVAANEDVTPKVE
ncbi:hypothetical protein PHMEG_0007363 [Phytophthora megakarya]|uniref:Uncharacterized protein n=1 Tax=Phytophthora megakarya TaxID=4795 RepID=A0A225WLG9_9STRA|nr:hypothetical protein PHMEG_0007363 [Phytophthora megakarya]